MAQPCLVVERGDRQRGIAVGIRRSGDDAHGRTRPEERLRLERARHRGVPDMARVVDPPAQLQVGAAFAHLGREGAAARVEAAKAGDREQLRLLRRDGTRRGIRVFGGARAAREECPGKNERGEGAQRADRRSRAWAPSHPASISGCRRGSRSALIGVKRWGERRTSVLVVVRVSPAKLSAVSARPRAVGEERGIRYCKRREVGHLDRCRQAGIRGSRRQVRLVARGATRRKLIPAGASGPVERGRGLWGRVAGTAGDELRREFGGSGRQPLRGAVGGCRGARRREVGDIDAVALEHVRRRSGCRATAGLLCC